jgi:hypothetical protein
MIAERKDYINEPDHTWAGRPICIHYDQAEEHRIVDKCKLGITQLNIITRQLGIGMHKTVQMRDVSSDELRAYPEIRWVSRLYLASDT